MEQYNKFRDQNVIKLVLGMSIPGIITMLVQALYSMVDSIFIAKYDLKALTGVSLIMPVQIICMAIAMGLTVGISANLAKKYGENKEDEAINIALHGMVLGFSLGSVVVILITVFLKSYLGLFTVNNTVLNYGITYGRMLLICGLLHIFSQSVVGVIQSKGYMVAAMIAMGVGSITNVVLDPLLIWGKLGFPKMEILGAGLATVIGQAATTVLVIVFLIIKNKEIHIKLNKFKFKISIFSSILKTGLPTMLITAISSLMITFMNKILAPFGLVYITVFGVYCKVQTLVSMPIIGMGQGILPIISFNYGAKDRKRVEEVCKVSILLSVGISTIVLLLFQFKTQLILSLFNLDQETMQVGIRAFKLISIAFPLIAAINITNNFFQGLEHANISFIVILLREIFLLVPLAYICFNVLGVQYGWLCYLFANIITIVYSFFEFRKIYFRLEN